jgi:hypothetical protein
MKLLIGGRRCCTTNLRSRRESLVLPDSTIWSHAATLGTRFKGDAFTIDAASLRTS